jgi:acyl-coenzyme A synthetase/AMP-(fatty) acid ligase
MGLRAALAEYFSGPALPRRVHVVPSLPRLDSGKVDRARIRMTRKGTGKR